MALTVPVTEMVEVPATTDADPREELEHPAAEYKVTVASSLTATVTVGLVVLPTRLGSLGGVRTGAVPSITSP